MEVDRYTKDLDALLQEGNKLDNAIRHECSPREYARVAKEQLGDKSEKLIEGLPSFKKDYQSWYSEAKALVRQLLPDRLSDFTRYYEKPKSRREITYANYVIEDYLEGLNVTGQGDRKIVGPDAAIPRFEQQLGIVKSIQERFRSSLFDIRQMAQADLFDSELDAAKELAKNRYTRAAGAVAGVVLEKHLKEVCGNHGITVRKTNPQISDLNDSLKSAAVIETPQWRFLQHLGDLRNLCAHDRESEPTTDQINDLLAGVMKVTKTIF